MQSFTYEGLPAQVFFGRGSIGRIDDVLDQMGIVRAILLSTTGQAERAAQAVLSRTGRVVSHFSDARMHTPVETTTKAVAAATADDADGVIAFGGGSAIGLAKAVALRTDLPQLAIPTTYAGSEMTPVLGETKDGAKITQRSLRVLPEAVIYDAELTLSLPPNISAASGINALAHAVEGLYARDTNPIVQLFAQDGIARLVRALPRVVADGRDIAAREDALHGVWLCAMVLAVAGMSLHHKLCHTLGGMFRLPHAQTHAVILPHALAYNQRAAPDAMAILTRTLAHENPVTALVELSRRLDAPRTLRDLGMPEEGIAAAADAAVANAYWNPRPIEHGAILELLKRAWAGDPPAMQ